MVEAFLISNILRGLAAMLIGLLVTIMCGLLLLRRDFIDSWAKHLQVRRKVDLKLRTTASTRLGLVGACVGGVFLGLLIMGLGVAAVIR